MCSLEKLNFKISPGSMPPDPPIVYSRLRRSILCYFCWTNSEVLPPDMLLPMGNSEYNITYLNYTKTCLFFSLEKGAPSVLYRDIYFNDY